MAGALVLLGLYFFFDPSSAGFFPKCPFKSLTGLDCPGCGSQRAVHDLLHLNVRGAWSHNALLIIALPYVVGGLLFNTPYMQKRFPAVRRFFFGEKAIYVVLAVVLGYFVLRNL